MLWQYLVLSGGVSGGFCLGGSKMSSDELMNLIEQFAQEVKDYGHIADSEIYRELKSAVYETVDELNKLKFDNPNNPK